jgi:hypothetical protein
MKLKQNLNELLKIKFIKRNWKKNHQTKLKPKFKWNWTQNLNKIENKIQMKLKTEFKWNYWTQNSSNEIENKIHQIKLKLKFINWNWTQNSNEIKNEIQIKLKTKLFKTKFIK